jgi:hypothetical protein
MVRRLLNEDEVTAFVALVRRPTYGRPAYVDDEMWTSQVIGRQTEINISPSVLAWAVEEYEWSKSHAPVWSSEWCCENHADRGCVIGAVLAQSSVLVPSPRRLCPECYEAQAT